MVKTSNKSKNKMVPPMDDKGLKLPTPTDKPEDTLDQSNDFERFVGTVRAYISKEKTCPHYSKH